MSKGNQANPGGLQPGESPLNQFGFQPVRGPRPGEVAEKVRAKQTVGTIRRIWGYVKFQRRALVTVLASTVITTVLSLLGPYLIGKIIDNYIVPRQLDGFFLMGLILLGVYVLAAVFTWIQQYASSSLSHHTVRHMRQDLFEHIQRLPVRFFDQRTHGDLMSRTTNDLMNVSSTLNMTVVQFISSVLVLVGSLIMMLSLSLWMTLVTVLTVPLVTIVAKQVTKYTRKFFSEQQKQLGQVNGFVQEHIAGLKVTKAFAREQEAVRRFREMNEQLRAIGVKAQSLSGSMGPIMNTMRNVTFLVIAVFGGIFAYHDLITVGVIASFLSYSNQFSQPVNQLANQYNMLQAAIAGAERIFEILDQEPETMDEAVPVRKHVDNATDEATNGNEASATWSGETPTSSTGPVHGEIRPDSEKPFPHQPVFDVIIHEPLRGEVVFDQVWFGYRPDRPVLKNVSFHAQPGQMIALVGPTGAGKTTIINLLTRFYEIQSGRILIDGKDIRDMDKHALRRQIGVVLQDAYVFSGTIRENIRYGRLDATDEEVEQAARLANADPFIRKLPAGYETVLTPEGGNLSQGQRQLLTIARAVLANPAILILDEATSNVDTRTEHHIQEAMKKLMKGRTSFVIAHRLSTIREADKILVIHQGEVIEQGTHGELLARNGYYAELYRHQFIQGHVG